MRKLLCVVRLAAARADLPSLGAGERGAGGLATAGQRDRMPDDAVGLEVMLHSTKYVFVYITCVRTGNGKYALVLEIP